MNITFTSAACDYIRKMVEKEHGVGFRLSVKKTGCSGYSYLPAIVQTINPADSKLIIENGITIFVDPMWQSMLEGVQIDYVEEDKNGLKQKRLVFSNPNEASRCGCGESFHV
jgi:iron-sulfur cluster assembly protein